jgi:hypothetical protein
MNINGKNIYVKKYNLENPEKRTNTSAITRTTKPITK